MFPYNLTNNCLPTCQYSNPFSTALFYKKIKSNKLNNYCISNCYRPLQQLYKTTYRPIYGNDSSNVHIACLCCPSERFKTTNMTYGNFYYNPWISKQIYRPINYDKSIFMQCYDNNKMKYQSLCNNHMKKYEI